MGAEASSESAQISNEDGNPEASNRGASIQVRPNSSSKPVIAGKAVKSIPRVLLRGERGSGKSSLFTRLHGTPFNSAYVPTNRIKASTVSWSIRNSRERKRVSVELWDVVDEDDARVDDDEVVVDMHDGDDPDESLHEDGGNSLVVPYTFDEISSQKIYKSVQGVIFVINPYSATSLEYVRQNIESVPPDIDMLIIVGFKDLIENMDSAPVTKNGKIRVTLDDVNRMVEEFKEDGWESITIIEASVYSGFGLRDLYRFLYLPFVRLQEQALRAKLDFLSRERIKTRAEVHASNRDTSKYDEYVKAFDAKKAAAKAENLNDSVVGTPLVLSPEPLSLPEPNMSGSNLAASGQMKLSTLQKPRAEDSEDTLSSPRSLLPPSAGSPASIRTSESSTLPSPRNEQCEDYDFDRVNGTDTPPKGAGTSSGTKIPQTTPNNEVKSTSGHSGDTNQGLSRDDAMVRKQLSWMESVRQKDLEKERKRELAKERDTEKERRNKVKASQLSLSHRDSGTSGGGATMRNSRGGYSISPQTLTLDDQADDSIDDFNPSIPHGGALTSKSRSKDKTGSHNNALNDFLGSESVDSMEEDSKHGSAGGVKKSAIKNRTQTDPGDSDDEEPSRKRTPSFKRAFKKLTPKKKVQESAGDKENEAE